MKRVAMSPGIHFPWLPPEKEKPVESNVTNFESETRSYVTIKENAKNDIQVEVKVYAGDTQAMLEHSSKVALVTYGQIREGLRQLQRLHEDKKRAERIEEVLGDQGKIQGEDAGPLAAPGIGSRDDHGPGSPAHRVRNRNRKD